MLPSLFLMQLFIWVDGRKQSSLMAEYTGLSQSYLRRGRAQLKESTLKKAMDYAFSRVDVTVQKDLPSLGNKYPSSFQDIVYINFLNKQSSLYSFAKEIDEFNFALMSAHKGESFHTIKKVVLDSNLLVNEAYLTEENQPKGKLKLDLQGASDLKTVLSVTKKISLNIFFSFLAALDLQFCSEAFGTKLKVRPLFLDLLPKSNFVVPELGGRAKLPKKDRFRLPNRRLLELTHAIFYYSRNERWPRKPVGRKELAIATGYNEAIIGNLFDGTKKLTFKTYDAIQQKLDKNVGLNRNVSSFQPLLLASVLFQHSLIRFDPNSKIESIFFGNWEVYTKFWNAHYKEWGSQLPSGDTDWPTWLDS